MEYTPFPELREINARLLACLPPRASFRLRNRIVDYEIAEMAVLFRTGELSAEQVTIAYLARIYELNGPFEVYDDNGGFNAFVRIDAQEALSQARWADQWLNNPDDARGPAPVLCGIALGFKDVMAICGRESKNGTHAFDTNVAHHDATVVARLREQGAVLLGHTICSEYSGSVHGDFGANAWDLTRVPGGSSSGSGIAPVARLCAGALATETGGSLITPAAANGASGIKPSLGLASTAGLMPLLMGWDVPGTIARSIRDASLILSAISGLDPLNDPLTLSQPIPALQLPCAPRPGPTPLAGITIGIPQTDWMFPDGLGQPPASLYDTDYREAFERFKAQLTGLGARVLDFPGLDMTQPQNRPYYGAGPIFDTPDPFMRLTPAALTSYPVQYEARYWKAVADFAVRRPSPYREELLRRFNPAFYHAAIEQVPYPVMVEADQRRRRQQQVWYQALHDHQVDFMLVMPLGSHIGLRFGLERAENGLQVRRTYYDLPNALGWPMVTFPIGHGRTGVPASLPINAAFWGTRFAEVQIIQAALDFQAHYPQYHDAAPPTPRFDLYSKRPDNMPRVRDIAPHDSTDPLVIERGRSWT